MYTIHFCILIESLLSVKPLPIVQNEENVSKVAFIVGLPLILIYTPEPTQATPFSQQSKARNQKNIKPQYAHRIQLQYGLVEFPKHNLGTVMAGIPPPLDALSAYSLAKRTITRHATCFKTHGWHSVCIEDIF